MLVVCKQFIRCYVQVVQPRVKRKMFAVEYVRKIIESGSEAEAATLYSELEAQVRAVDHHVSLIDQLEDDSLGKIRDSQGET